MTGTLAVLGAGPKAIAVAAKAAELRDMGVDTPEIVVVERTGIAANWTAAGGWTDGEHRLGTSPEKDVGFPYRSTLVPRRNAELDERMTRHSWQAYLIDTAQFAEWVDRGRPDRSERPPRGGDTHLGRGTGMAVAHRRHHRLRRRGDDHRARAGRTDPAAGGSAGDVDRRVLAARRRT